ncbi:hypothetical protein B296_00013424 [Ensete ventricosum]|uniref:Uncharacterized protein n=1 Tax=Ensete ventricosum TaxID=4639 RepID=A0A427A1P7_ENSVE|nr:hypothetical protein B296_00013424 [Ensete ventricosum]
MFSLSSSEERNFEDYSPFRSSSSMDERSSKAMKAMLREHDEDSIITESSLPKIRATYHIFNNNDLHASEVGQRPFDPFPNGFSLSVDALEAGELVPDEVKPPLKRLKKLGDLSVLVPKPKPAPEVLREEESSRKKRSGSLAPGP